MKLVVTGFGIRSSLGENAGEVWTALESGQNGIRKITGRFEVAEFGTQIAAMVPSGTVFDTEEERILSYASVAAEEALQHAEISDYSEVALVLGTSNGIIGRNTHDVTRGLARNLGLGNMAISVSTACTSSSHAIGFAADLLSRGVAKYVLAGGVDTLTTDIFAGFHSLGLLSTNPCAPFSTQLGTTLGEGGAFIVMEMEETANRRNIQPLALFNGYGFAADAYHDTSPDPHGAGMARAILAALNQAQLHPDEIDYINLHGTGTAANDAAEWSGVRQVFGARAVHIPSSSSKSFLGHGQGASGAMEVITTLLAMENDKIPPTHNLDQPRLNIPEDPVSQKYPRPFHIRNMLSTNAAFGGVNTALLFGKPNGNGKDYPVHERKIFLKSPFIVKDSMGLTDSLPQSAIRGLDPSARVLSNAVANTLSGAEIEYRSRTCEELGIFVGQNEISPESHRLFQGSVEARGYSHLSANAFTRMVVNYATGACCRIFGLKGPLATVSSEVDNGLISIILGANYLSSHLDIKHLVAASVHESGSPDEGSEAASILLTTDSGDIRLKDWSMAQTRQEANEIVLKNSGITAYEEIYLDHQDQLATEGIDTISNAMQKMSDDQIKACLISDQCSNSMAVSMLLVNMG